MTAISLQIEPRKAREIYKTAPPELKIILEESCGKEFFAQKITDRVKSYEDACFELGRRPMDEATYSGSRRAMLTHEGYPENLIDSKIKAEIAQLKVETITRALNEEWEVDLTDPSQRRWIPWFNLSSGFAVDVTLWYDASANAGYASRLCFKSEELARYAGKQFVYLYKAFMVQ